MRPPCLLPRIASRESRTSCALGPFGQHLISYPDPLHYIRVGWRAQNPTWLKNIRVKGPKIPEHCPHPSLHTHTPFCLEARKCPCSLGPPLPPHPKIKHLFEHPWIHHHQSLPVFITGFCQEHDDDDATLQGSLGKSQ